MNVGRHRARAMGIDFGIASTGTEQCAVTFEVTEGECAGETIGWFGSFTEKAAKYSIQALRALGWKGNDLAAIVAEDLVDEVDLVVQEEQDQQGEPRLRVRYINRPGTGAAMLKTPMTATQRAAFAARMRGQCMAEKPVAAGQQKPKAQAAPRATSNRDAAGIQEASGMDDIPF